MASAPDRLIQEAFVASNTFIVRHVEIFGFDGVTPWKPELWNRLLVGGTVAVDGSRDERRSVDCELDNATGLLDPEPGGLWYDKVLKVFYGLKMDGQNRAPRIAIVEEFSAEGQALALKSLMAQAGIKSVFFDPLITSYSEIEDFDIIVSISATHTQKLALLTEAFNNGKSVMTFGINATTAQLPYIIGASASGISSTSGERSFEKNTSLTNLALNGWTDEWYLSGPHSYRKINATTPQSITLADTWDADNGFSPGIVLRAELGGPFWLHVMQYEFDAAAFAVGADMFSGFLGVLVNVLDYYEPEPIWEMQIGEFVADSIEDADPQGQRIRFVGRDYTARCLASEFTKATTFKAAEKIEDVIKTVATNCKITKFNLPTTTKTLGKDMTWERGTNRWTVMKDIALAHNYELFFDHQGYLVMREQRDPLTTPPSLILSTGTGGNLVSRGAKTSAAQLYNRVSVIGESSDSSVPLVYGEASNTNPNSPSSVDAIGERTKNISSPLVTTNQQAQTLAETMLTVSALEEFDLNFEAVLFPWAEAGEIVQMGPDEGVYWGPDRFLINSLSLPLDMGPMSGNAKRVTRVS